MRGEKNERPPVFPALFFPVDCRDDGDQDSGVQRVLQRRRQAVLHPVLQHRRSDLHRPHVPVLAQLVRQPLRQGHTEEVSAARGAVGRPQSRLHESRNGLCHQRSVHCVIFPERVYVTLVT